MKAARIRDRLLAVTLLFATSVACVWTAEWIVSFLDRRAASSDRLDPGLVLYDDHLGWRLTPEWKGRHRHRDFDVRYTTNREGFRSSARHDPGTPSIAGAGHRDVAVLGDSFTFGFGVDAGATFVDLLDADAAGTVRFTNFGVPGYSTDQQLLQAVRLIEPRRFDVVILVVYLGNDLIDNELNFPLHVPAAKPYFEMTEGRLQLRNQPVPRRAKNEIEAARSFASVVLAGREAATGLRSRVTGLALSRRLGVQWRTAQDELDLDQRRFASALELFTALVEELHRTTARSGTQLHLALLAGRSFVAEPASHSAQYQDFIREQILKRAGQRGIRVIDLASHLREREGSRDLYFPYDGHLTPEGHGVVAARIRDQLGVGDPAVIGRAD